MPDQPQSELFFNSSLNSHAPTHPRWETHLHPKIEWIASIPPGDPHFPRVCRDDGRQDKRSRRRQAGYPFRDRLRADMPHCSSGHSAYVRSTGEAALVCSDLPGLHSTTSVENLACFSIFLFSEQAQQQLPLVDDSAHDGCDIDALVAR